MVGSLVVLALAQAGCGTGTGVLRANHPPERPLITSHAEGDLVRLGTLQVEGLVQDADDGLSDLSITWSVGSEPVCGPTAPLGLDGETACELELQELGDTPIVLSVEDPFGATGTAKVTLEVVPSETPVVEVTSPTEGAEVAYDEAFELTGRISDVDDDVTLLDVGWTLEPPDGGPKIGVDIVDVGLDGVLEPSLLALDVAGSWSVELRAEDPWGMVATDLVEFTVVEDPTCSIQAPVEDSTVQEGESIVLEGTVSNLWEDPTEVEIGWSSDLDGSLRGGFLDADGKVSSTPLGLESGGTHVISMFATAPDGEACVAETAFFLNTWPAVSFEHPDQDQTFPDGRLIYFEASIEDTETAFEDLSIVWQSDVDGVFATGVADTLYDGLSVGTHIIEVVVDDEHGGRRSDGARITIEAGP